MDQAMDIVKLIKFSFQRKRNLDNKAKFWIVKTGEKT